MSGTMILHAGAEKVTEQQVRAVKPPKPEGRWLPVGYGEILDRVYDNLGPMKLKIRDKQFALSPDQGRFFGLMDVKGRFGNTSTDHEGVGMVIGVRGSMDKSVSQAIALGSRVFVCDNLAISGEVVLKTKHTINMLKRLPGMVADAMGKMPEFLKHQNALYDDWREIDIEDPEVVHDTLVLAMKEGVIAPTRIPHVLAEWEAPTTKAFEGDRTVWGLYNAFTADARRSFGINPFTAAKQTMGLTGLFSRRFAPENLN